MRIRDFKGKKCFITGAASGIGRATAIAMAREGAELYLTDIDKKRLEETVAMIVKAGGRVLAWEAFDIADHGAVESFTGRIHRNCNTVDIVMNIAGTSIWGGVELLKHEHWKKMVDINLMGPINVIECILPAMVRAGRGGHLVNVSSAAGLIALPWHAAYSASKFGLRGISEVLRYDLRRHGIGVSVVCPGAVRTPLVGTVKILGVDREHLKVKALKEKFESRAVTPEIVASSIMKAIRRNAFLVTTSFDIALIYFFKKKMFFIYHCLMILLNRMMMSVYYAAREDGEGGRR